MKQTGHEERGTSQGFHCYDKKMPWPEVTWEESVCFSLPFPSRKEVRTDAQARQELGGRRWCKDHGGCCFLKAMFSLSLFWKDLISTCSYILGTLDSNTGIRGIFFYILLPDVSVSLGCNIKCKLVGWTMSELFITVLKGTKPEMKMLAERALWSLLPYPTGEWHFAVYSMENVRATTMSFYKVSILMTSWTPVTLHVPSHVGS